MALVSSRVSSMIEPYKLYDSRSVDWWKTSRDGLYLLDHNNQSKIIVIRDHDLALQIVKTNGRLSCFADGNFISFDIAMSELFERWPEYAEWVLFHPEYIS